jgi:hypothetical protein
VLLSTLFPRRARPASFFALLTLTACAGSTIGSGVGDQHLEHPPWYAGDRVARDTRIAHLPITYQRGSQQDPIFEPAGSPGTPVASLLTEMNRYLDSLAITTRLDAGGVRGTPPDVMFGCVTDAAGDCVSDPLGEVQDINRRTLRLAVGRPSDAWVESLRSATAATNASRTLLITLEVGQYWTRQRNLRGSKEVELGTGYSVDVPWLTSLETPVTVLQLTGALLAPDGDAIRIGAEGLFARRTRLLVSAVGEQELLSNDDVERLRTLRRTDLAGNPLVWQAALRSLVAELTGRRELAPR